MFRSPLPLVLLVDGLSTDDCEGEFFTGLKGLRAGVESLSPVWEPAPSPTGKMVLSGLYLFWLWGLGLKIVDHCLCVGSPLASLGRGRVKGFGRCRGAG